MGAYSIDRTLLRLVADRAPDEPVEGATDGLRTGSANAFRRACAEANVHVAGDLLDGAARLEDALELLPEPQVEAILLELHDWLRELADAPTAAPRPAIVPVAEKAPPAPPAAPAVSEPLPRPSIEVPPETREEAVAWARERRIAAVLDQPLTVLYRAVYGLPRTYNDHGIAIAALFLPVIVTPASIGLGKSQLGLLRDGARTYLAQLALERAMRQKKRDAWLGTALTELPEAVRTLDQRLVEVLARLEAEGAPVPEIAVGYPFGTVRFLDGPAARLDVNPDGRPDTVLISFRVSELLDGSYDPVSPWGDSQAWKETVAIAAQTLRDFLRDPKSPLAESVRSWLSVPAWSRTLLRIESLESRNVTTTTGERLAFRFSLQGTRFRTVEVLSQSGRKGGGFTAGRKIGAAAALRIASSPLEQRIVEILVELEARGWYLTTPAEGRRVATLLALLADHPLVLFGDDAKKPARIRRARVAVAVIASTAGYGVQLSVGGKPFSPQELNAARLPDGTLVCVDLEAGILYLSALAGVASHLVTALSEFPAEFPAEATDQLLALLERSQDTADVTMPDELIGTPMDADARPIVRMELLPGDALQLSVRVRPIAEGPLLEPGSGADRVFGIEAGGRVSAHRDLAREREAAEILLAELPLGDAAREATWSFRVDDPDRAADVIVALSERQDALVEWPSGGAPNVVRASRREVRLRIEKRRDWFGVEGEVEIDGAKVALATLLAAARANHRFVRISPTQIVSLAKDLRERLREVDDTVQVGARGVVEASATSVAALDRLVEDQSQVAAAKEWVAARARMRAAETYDPQLPPGLRAELRAYQQEGFRWLARLASWSSGACLADDMGLGKTVQTLALLLHRQAEGPTLVIAPTTVGPNWVAEATRFAPALRVQMYRGPDRRALLVGLGPGDVLVSSYDIIARDVEALAPVRFGTLILDEAQAIKNAAARRAAAVRELNAAFRVALTGTPIENHLGELWSLFRAVSPSLLGSWERFRQRFAGPIERDRDPERRRALVAVIRPFLLRRTKAVVAPELPARTETVRLVTLSPAERERYETERLAAMAAVEDADPLTARFAMLAALTRLRRLACNVQMVDKTSVLPSSKLALFLELVDELREAGHRALVFSQFTSHLALVKAALDAKGIGYLYLDGQTVSAERQRLVAAFQGGEADLFLLSLKAGGTGINLTGADYVLHLDPWWNPAAEDQATDRAHRIGQDKPVTVVRLVSAGTIEEAVLALHGEKRELAESLLTGGDLAAKLTAKELLDLVRAGESAGTEQDA